MQRKIMPVKSSMTRNSNEISHVQDIQSHEFVLLFYKLEENRSDISYGVSISGKEGSDGKA